MFARIIALGSFCLFFAASKPITAQLASEPISTDVVAKIKQEGMDRSKVMETISYLTDVHGPRLTGSPITKRAGEWAKQQLTEWGLENSRLESWGPFGRGWTLEAFTANILEPTFSPLIAIPKAWTPSTPKTIRGEPILLEVTKQADLEKYRGKLLRAIVMISPPREVKPLFDPPASRRSDENLLALANADPTSFRSGRPSGPFGPGSDTFRGGSDGARQRPSSTSPESAGSTSSARDASSRDASPPAAQNSSGTTTASSNSVNSTGAGPASNSAPPGNAPATDFRAAMQLQYDKWQFAYDEGAAVVLEPGRGDGGTVFVSGATLPRRPDSSPRSQGDRSQGDNAGGDGTTNRIQPWSPEAKEVLPQVVLAVEHYNRIARMIQKGAHPILEIDIGSRFHAEDLNSFNIIAEIPGSDLKDEIVMLGAHFDSWHAGTGATDNAVGCAVAMEAVRILKAIGTKPRRTIRIGLWTGEEQGLLGSRAYVAEHFGKLITPPASRQSGPSGGTPPASTTAATAGAGPSAESSSASSRESQPERPPAPQGRSRGDRPPLRYEVTPAYEKLSAYFNLDNGTGKIRGIYLQGNENVRGIFRTWLRPFSEMGASTISVSNTGGTDHLSFDSIGLPGFQFIQDPLEYDTRTHHSSMDVYERIQADDAKQASIIMATFVYHTAMRDEKLPRKPLEGVVVPASTSTPVAEASASNTDKKSESTSSKD